MVNKVFCKDCKHCRVPLFFRIFSFLGKYEFADCISDLVNAGRWDYVANKKSEPYSCSYVNYAGTCKFYEEK